MSGCCMSFQSFHNAVDAPPYDPQAVHQRKGQWAFNFLHTHRPMLANTLRGSPTLDPFHQDDNLPAFYGWVEQNWDEEHACDDPAVAAAATL